MAHATQRYRYLSELGRGAFGYVILAQDTTTQELVAVKKLPRHLAADMQMERELLAHSSLRHPHITRFHQVFLSPHHINLVLEYVPDGTLLEHVQRQRALPEAQARWLFQQLVLAVDYCHQIGISNRDIKLDNILLDKSIRGRPTWPIMKICDFGYARAGANSEACSKVGTLSYMAPEVLQSNTYSTKKADIWSCGVVLYAMLCGCMPFAVLEQKTLVERIQRLAGDMQQKRFQVPDRLSEGAQDILKQLLHPDPKERIDTAGILAHPWFQTGLPAEALTMNQGFLRQPRACMQSEEDIWKIVRKAREAAAGYSLDDCLATLSAAASVSKVAA